MTTPDERGIPATVNDLLSYLDNTFPNRCPSLDWTEKKVWFEAGARSVVEHLFALRDRRDENIMETTDVHGE